MYGDMCALVARVEDSKDENGVLLARLPMFLRRPMSVSQGREIERQAELALAQFPSHRGALKGQVRESRTGEDDRAR